MNRIKDKIYLMIKYTLSFSIVIIFLLLLNNNIFISQNNITNYLKILNYKDVLLSKTFGVDIINNYSDYVLGDITTYLILIIKDINLFINIQIIIKLYLSGLFFILYSRYKEKSNISSISGALVYVFSTFSLYMVINNQYILNIMIYLPILFLVIERFINQNKKILYVIVLSLFIINSLINSVYVLLYLLIYAIILIINKYKDYGIKIVIFEIIKLLLYSLVSFFLTGIITYPIIKNGININNELITKDINYYKELLSLVFSLSSISILGLIFIKRNRNKNYIWLLILLLIPVLYPLNKEILVVTYLFINFLIIISFTNFYDNLIEFTKNDIKLLLKVIFIFLLILLLLNYKINNYALYSIISLLGIISILLEKGLIIRKYNKGIYSLIFIIFLILNICLSIYEFYPNNYISNNELKLSINNNAYTRTLFNNSINGLNKEFNLNKYKYSLSTYLVNKLGIKYTDKEYYGYNKYKNNIYVNKNNISLGNIYNTYITKDEYNELNDLEKQISLSKQTVLKSSDINNKYITKSNNTNYNILGLNNTKEQSNNITTIKLNDSINGELYLYIGNKYKKNIKVTYNDQIYNIKNKSNIYINLCNGTKILKDKIIIEGSSIEDVSVYEVSYNDYNSTISNLNSSNFHISSYNNNYIYGDINIDKDSLLELNIIKDDNIKVYIDNKEINTFTSNNYFIGMYINKGKHSIKIEYKENNLIPILISILGIILFIIILYFL